MVSSIVHSLPSPSALWNSSKVSACRNAVSAAFQRGREAFSSYASRPFSYVALAYDIYHRPSFPVATALYTATLFTFKQVLPFCLKKTIDSGYTRASHLLLKSVNFDTKTLATCLVNTINQQDEATVKSLLQAGADVNQPDEETGALPLQVAAWGEEKILQLLLSRGAEIDLTTAKTSVNPLGIAAGSGKSRCARVLLERGADPINTLYWACKYWNTEEAETGAAHSMIELLLDHGVDPLAVSDSGDTPLFQITRRREDFLRILIERARSRPSPNLLHRFFEKLLHFSPVSDVHAFWAMLSPPLIDIPDDYPLPPWMREIPSPVSSPTEEEQAYFQMIRDAAIEHPNDASVERHILPLLLRIRSFERAWQRAGSPRIEEVGDEAFFDEEGKNCFPSGVGAQCFHDSNKIQIHRNENSSQKIHALIFETMNLIQNENFHILEARARSGQIGREEYALLRERLEHNSTVWTDQMIGHIFRIIPTLSFSQSWKNLQRLQGGNCSHTDHFRNAWDRNCAKPYLSANRDFLRRRAREIAAHALPRAAIT